MTSSKTAPPLPLTMRDSLLLRTDIERSIRGDIEHRNFGYTTREGVETETAFILYRMACQLGLHATGTESALLVALARAEASLADLEAKLGEASAALAAGVAPAIALSSSAKAAEAALQARTARAAATAAGAEALKEIDAHHVHVAMAGEGPK